MSYAIVAVIAFAIGWHNGAQSAVRKVEETGEKFFSMFRPKDKDK